MTKIMIVEDNLRARRALKALMSQQLGIDVAAEASNGQEAIQSINKQVPDIVLMDVQMPVMDGLEATKIIKRNWPQIKVIILTMYPDHQQEALAAGADAFLMKECSTEKITALVHAFQEREAGDDRSVHGCPHVSISQQIK
ncbi:MAG TPA: response regulator transcription factor [Anaerolineales bacterium]|nr:response regulator transcription factor [Anaerolineales bacterium]